MTPRYAQQVADEIDKTLLVGIDYPIERMTCFSPIVGAHEKWRRSDFR